MILKMIKLTLGVMNLLKYFQIMYLFSQKNIYEYFYKNKKKNSNHINLKEFSSIK
jgi:hypothetical protein